MHDINVITLRKVSGSSMRNRNGKRSDLRSQLQDEIDKLALTIRELKAQADNVQKAADALGEELLDDGVNETPNIRLIQRNG